MKKKIFVILVVIIMCLSCFALGYFFRNGKSQKNEATVTSESNNSEVDELIKTPDRIVVKYESKYYEVTSADESFDKFVQICREGINGKSTGSISEEEIDTMKSTAKFVEFDYDTISKNNIFFLSTVDIGAIQMGDSDGTIISEKLTNVSELGKLCEEVATTKEGYTMDTSTTPAENTYNFMPSTYDFKEVKASKVYTRVCEDYEDFQKIANQYNLKFSNYETIKNDFENSTGILILSRYTITNFKVNIGNVKINFVGKDYINESGTGVSYQYQPTLILVSKIVNTNCIYYNYDNVSMEDNVTGTVENVCGVVKSKDADEITLSYTTDDDMDLGTIMLSSNNITNSTADDVKVGDFIIGTATVTSVSDDGKTKTYEAKSLSVQTKDEYNKLLENYLMGKTKISTSIVDYYTSESNYDGYVICAIYYGENLGEPDAYAKFYYDFYDGKTESYLGMSTHIEGNYGIVPNEIVDITFEEAVTDINKINVKMFEYIAD